MKDLPASVAERLQVLAYEDRAVAWLQIDLALTLVGAGGHLAAYRLEGLRLGIPAVEAAPFLAGLLPLQQTPEVIPSIELGGGRAADLHLHRDGETTWAILLDVTPERNRAQRMQQRAYDMTLAQEREAQLNRRLAAANAALIETQRELEASRDALLAAHAEVRVQAAELAQWNKTLEERVAAQLAEIERVSRLKRFLAPSLAELIVSSGDESILASHRRDIAALFCDLRGFTAFAESAEPEEVMELLQGYHATLVPLIQSLRARSTASSATA